jgi:hypothetical protein
VQHRLRDDVLANVRELHQESPRCGDRGRDDVRCPKAAAACTLLARVVNQHLGILSIGLSDTDGTPIVPSQIRIGAAHR